MNSFDREQLRLSLLRFLDANPSRWGMSVSLLWQMARAEGRGALGREEVAAELLYLADKKLVIEPVKSISPENRTWRISAEGRDFLALSISSE